MRPKTTGPGQLRYNKLDAFLCLFFILFWLLPAGTTNLTKKAVPFFPPFVSALHSTSNLFTQANYIWPAPYIQALPAGSARWVTLREEDFFPMQTFGYRTRLFEALYLGVDDPVKSRAVREELARWVAGRYRARTGLPVKTVRFVAGLTRVRQDNPPRGHWRTPDLKTFSPDDVYEISRHEITDAAGQKQ